VGLVPKTGRQKHKKRRIYLDFCHHRASGIFPGAAKTRFLQETGFFWLIKKPAINKLTLLDLKVRGFLRLLGLNIPIARVPRLTTFALMCVVISPQKCFGRRLSPSPGVGFYILSDVVILPYSFVEMDLSFYLTMAKSRPERTGFLTQFSDKIIQQGKIRKL
jgi:hypothetical protein